MASVLPFDELNMFNTQIRERYGTQPLDTKDEEDIIDELFDLFLLAYDRGNTETIKSLEYLFDRPQGISRTQAKPIRFKPTLEDVLKVVDKEVAGKTWKDRAKEYFDQGGTADDIVRIAETETHRIANTAALATAKKAGATNKTWMTMMDDRVRSTHDYLLGQTVSIDDDFYTYDGDHASAPGLFELAENNVNCRCELIFS